MPSWRREEEVVGSEEELGVSIVKSPSKVRSSSRTGSDDGKSDTCEHFSLHRGNIFHYKKDILLHCALHYDNIIYTLSLESGNIFLDDPPLTL